MENPAAMTLALVRVLGPLLVLRGASILISPQHFRGLIAALSDEYRTLSFSMIPVFLFVAFLSIALYCRDLSSMAGVLIFLMAIGGTAKCAFLILVPKLVVHKVQVLAKVRFVELVATVSLLLGGYFSWVGYFAN